MKFGKMMACATVLGCASAMNLEKNEERKGAPEARSQDKWTPSKEIIRLIDDLDSDNTLGFRGALMYCAKSGKGEICKTLEDDVK